MRQSKVIQLTPHQYQILTSILKQKSASDKSKERASLVLLAEKGFSNIDIAQLLNISRQKVARWRNRFLQTGLDSIVKDATRPGGKDELPEEIIKKVIQITLEQTPTCGDVWTQKSVAELAGISSSSVRRIWLKHGIQVRKSE